MVKSQSNNQIKFFLLFNFISFKKEINTPTLTATKWWIGGAAQTATHCVAFARLITPEKDHGVHSFIVPLRDIHTHKPLPGITLGDCGEKMGLPGVDNGFIQFNKIRIPREVF